MASRAERKRRARLLREVEGWFRDGLFDNEAFRVRGWSLKINFGPIHAALRKVSEAFSAIGAGLAGVFRVERIEPKQTRRRVEYPPRAQQRCVGLLAQARPVAFRLPRGGGRWSTR